jgi:hypothetical protein
MKTRLLWVAVVLAACAGFYFAMIKPALAPPPTAKIEALKKLRPPPPIPPPELPQPVIAQPVIPLPEIKPPPLPVVRNDPPMQQVVPIQDGATLDFSYGAPQVKVQGKDADELAKALKEMAEATKDVTFQPDKEK